MALTSLQLWGSRYQSLYIPVIVVLTRYLSCCFSVHTRDACCTDPRCTASALVHTQQCGQSRCDCRCLAAGVQMLSTAVCGAGVAVWLLRRFRVRPWAVAMTLTLLQGHNFLQGVQTLTDKALVLGHGCSHENL